MINRNIMPVGNDWRTPLPVFQRLDSIFNFDFDPFPYQHDYKIEGRSAYDREWGKRNFINPGYSSNQKEPAIEKAFHLYKEGGLSLLLLPNTSDIEVYHDFLHPYAVIQHRVKGRIQFEGFNTKLQPVNMPEFSDSKKGAGQHASIIFVLADTNIADHLVMVNHFDRMYNNQDPFLACDKDFKVDVDAKKLGDLRW